MSNSKVSPIVRDFQAIDVTETELKVLHTTRFDQQMKLANTILTRKSKNLVKDDITAECDRLISVAKDVVKQSGYVIENNHEMKNTWSAVKNIIRQKIMAKVTPKVTISLEDGKDEKGNIVINKVPVSNLPVTANSVSKNASKLNSVLNPKSTDGRKNGGKKRGANTTPKADTTPLPADDTTKRSYWNDTLAVAFKTTATSKLVINSLLHHAKTITRLAKPMGWNVTFEKIEK